MNAKEHSLMFVEKYNDILVQAVLKGLEGEEKATYVTDEARVLVGLTIQSFAQEMMDQYNKHQTVPFFITCYRETREKWGAFAARVNKAMGFDYIKPNGFQTFWETIEPGMALFADKHLIVPEVPK